MLKCYKIIEIFLYSVGVIPYAFLKLRENISWYHHRKREYSITENANVVLTNENIKKMLKKISVK